jgi:death-on-curing protein
MARPLTLAEVEFIAHAAASELMNYIDEPIPPFSTRSPNILESCLAEPFQTFDGKELHAEFTKKAALQFYLLIKNHPFQNGNKRMAVVITSVFCFINKRWLDIPPKTLYEIACHVAESKPADKDGVLYALEQTFMKHIPPLSRFQRLVKSR